MAEGMAEGKAVHGDIAAGMADGKAMHEDIAVGMADDRAMHGDIAIGRTMMHRERYFDILFRYLHDNDLLPADTQNGWRADFQKYFEMAGIDVDIILKMREQYGMGFENVFLINCKKNALLCDNFQIARDRMLIQTSVYFTALGCLLDYLIDCGNAGQRSEAKRKLGWGYCKDYFLGRTIAKENSAIDLLYEKVSIGMSEISVCNQERFEYIIGLVKQALASELAVNAAGKEALDEDIVLGKSVLFVKIAAEILLGKKSVVKSADKELMEAVGHVFALMDDLCDLYEDMEIGQMNLLMEYMQEDTDSNREAMVKDAADELVRNLQVIKNHYGGQLYEFILQEVREWGLGNAELRKRLWCRNG